MSLGRYHGTAFALSGSQVVVAPLAQIEVKRETDGALASIFSDRDGLVGQANPFAADASGRFAFHAAGIAGGYRIRVTEAASPGEEYTHRYIGIGTMTEVDNPMTSVGDFIIGGANGTAERLAAGTIGHMLFTDEDTVAGALWLPPAARADRIINGEIVESHASNSVTYTLKGKGGADLSATNPCYLLFPSATLTSGDFDIVKLVENISITLQSGNNLGHASAIPQHTFINALKTGSTAELVVSNLPPDYPGTFLGQRLITTTSSAGSPPPATSATGVYSTTARSNVAWIPLAKVKGTQTTAGLWAADPTQIDMAPFTLPRCAFVASRDTAQTIANNTDTKVQFDDEAFDHDGVYDAATNFRYQPNVAGLYEISVQVMLNAAVDQTAQHASIMKSGTVVKYSVAGSRASGTGSQGGDVTELLLLNGTSEYVEAGVFQGSGGNLDSLNSATYGRFSGARVSG